MLNRPLAVIVWSDSPQIGKRTPNHCIGTVRGLPFIMAQGGMKTFTIKSTLG